MHGADLLFVFRANHDPDKMRPDLDTTTSSYIAAVRCQQRANVQTGSEAYHTSCIMTTMFCEKDV